MLISFNGRRPGTEALIKMKTFPGASWFMLSKAMRRKWANSQKPNFSLLARSWPVKLGAMKKSWEVYSKIQQKQRIMWDISLKANILLKQNEMSLYCFFVCFFPQGQAWVSRGMWLRWSHVCCGHQEMAGPGAAGSNTTLDSCMRTQSVMMEDRCWLTASGLSFIKGWHLRYYIPRQNHFADLSNDWIQRFLKT